jgi:type I restriction enzyme S subunit
MDLGGSIKSNKIMLNGPVVLISKLNPRIPRVWFVPPSNEVIQVASTEFVPVQAKNKIPLSYIFAVMSSESFCERLVGMAGGTSTSHQRVKPRDVFATPMAHPPHALVAAAGGHLGALFGLVRELEAANRMLAASRDLLLPRLISGHLSVQVAERQLELAA